mgnify:CR=1 FL=1
MGNKESKQQRIERLERRNKMINEKFLQLRSKLYNKKTRLYSDETILEMLSEQFHLSTRTIDDIVFGRVNYKKQTKP